MEIVSRMLKLLQKKKRRQYFGVLSISLLHLRWILDQHVEAMQNCCTQEPNRLDFQKQLEAAQSIRVDIVDELSFREVLKENQWDTTEAAMAFDRKHWGLTDAQ